MDTESFQGSIKDKMVFKNINLTFLLRNMIAAKRKRTDIWGLNGFLVTREIKVLSFFIFKGK